MMYLYCVFYSKIVIIHVHACIARFHWDLCKQTFFLHFIDGEDAIVSGILIYDKNFREPETSEEDKEKELKIKQEVMMSWWFISFM